MALVLAAVVYRAMRWDQGALEQAQSEMNST